MHINFITKKKFEWNLESLKKIEISRLAMVSIAGSIILFIVLFAVVQKVRLNYMVLKKTELQASIFEMKGRVVSEGAVATGVARRSEVITLFEKRVIWSKVLNRLASDLPKRIWLKSIIKSGGGRGVLISCEAQEQSVVAGFLRYLSDLGIFSDVKLLTSNIVGEGSSAKVALSIQCVLK